MTGTTDTGSELDRYVPVESNTGYYRFNKIRKNENEQ